jgi:hypothetical protein
MGRFMSPEGLGVVSLDKTVFGMQRKESQSLRDRDRKKVKKSRHTLPILEPLLDNRIIGIRQHLQLLQILVHRHQLPLLADLPPKLRYIRRLHLRDPFPLLLDLLQLDLPVCSEDLARFLEALVGQLLEGDVAGAGEGGAAPTGADGEEATGGEEVLFFAGVDCVGVEGRGWCGGRCGREGSFFVEERCGGNGSLGEEGGDVRGFGAS